MEALLEKVAEINHYDPESGIRIEDVPWYVRLEAKYLEEGLSKHGAFYEKLENVDLLHLFDITLSDLLGNEEWQPSGGKSVKVAIGGLGLPANKKFKIAHEKHDGTIEYLAAEYVDGKLILMAPSFSLYGVVVETEEEDTSTNQTTTGNTDSSNAGAAPANSNNPANPNNPAAPSPQQAETTNARRSNRPTGKSPKTGAYPPLLPIVALIGSGLGLGIAGINLKKRDENE
jgi:hypothetical protein